MLFYDGGRILVKKEDGIRYPTFAEAVQGKVFIFSPLMRKGFTWATGHWQKDCWKRDMSLKISASCAGAAQNILDLRESPDGSSITGTRAGSSVEGAAHPWCRMKKSG